MTTKPHLLAQGRAPASFLPESPRLPGAPRCGPRPSPHAVSRNPDWKVSVIASFVSELKLSEESRLTAKVKFKGETEAQGQEFRLSLSANTRGNGTVLISVLLEWIPRSRPGKQAAYLQKASENFRVLKQVRLLRFLLEFVLEL